MVLIVNREGIVDEVLNYQTEICVTLTPEQQKGTTIRELFQHNDLKGDSGKKLLDAFQDTIKTRQVNMIAYEVEKEGLIGYAEGYIIPFEENYTFGIFRNITKRK